MRGSMNKAAATGWFGKVVPVLIVLGVVAWTLLKPGGTSPATPGAQAPSPSTGSSSEKASAPAREPAAAPTQARTPAPSAASVAGAPGSLKDQAPAARASGSSPSFAGTSIKVGAWNIEWLGKPDDRAQFAKDIAQDPKLIAQYVIGSGVSILGVAEIVSNRPGRPIRSPELEAAIAAIKAQTGQVWDYALNPGRQDGDQLTGVLWNTGVATAITAAGKPWVQPADVPWRVPISEGRGPTGSRLWARPPHAMKFSLGEGRTDLVVIVVHMKADYEGDFAAHRAMEMERLVAALPAVRKQFGDDDIVIVGDTNITSPREAMLATAEDAGWVDLNRANLVTTWRGGFTDRAFVPGAQPEFKGSTFWVFSDAFLRERRWRPGDFKRELSDHYMVGAVMSVMPDDD